jgi:uncharacterized protein YndB with AHSA1/START domain
MLKAGSKQSPRMSDEAVKAKTGKTWKAWFAILDKAGGRKLTHQEIVKYLHTKHGVGPWWQQMLTVTYEQARGLREKHQKPDGFEISISRTINAPLAKLFKSIANEKTRVAWLPESSLTIRKVTTNKSIRFAWTDGKSSCEVSLLSKTADKTQVVVTHRKLPDAKAAARMKAYWGKALDRLRASLGK